MPTHCLLCLNKGYITERCGICCSFMMMAVLGIQTELVQEKAHKVLDSLQASTPRSADLSSNKVLLEQVRPCDTHQPPELLQPSTWTYEGMSICKASGGFILTTPQTLSWSLLLIRDHVKGDSDQLPKRKSP